MGLIRTLLGTALNTGSGVLADQWKEVFYTDSLSGDTLMVRGHKKNSKGTFNKGNENVISNGSLINVADGQCAIIVSNGAVVEVAAEPGQFKFDSSTEPTIFGGNLGDGIKQSWETFKKRFTYGGETGTDQRVYFFNTKEMTGNKFGTPNPIPFRAVDKNIGLDMDTSLRCSGVYSIRLTDPIKFYRAVAGNVKESYTLSEISTQLKVEFMQALQPAIGKLSELELRPSFVPSHVEELTGYMNECLSGKFAEQRGFEVVSIALNPVVIPEEDQQTIKDLQKAASLRNPEAAAGVLAAAQADAMRMAASNTAGAMTGFMGMGMANASGGMNLGNLYAMGAQNNAYAQQAQYGQAQQYAQQPEQIRQPAPQPQVQPSADSWQCTCGSVNTGKFCPECGAPKPQPPAAKFCPNCGSEVEAGAKFCPECGTKLI